VEVGQVPQQERAGHAGEAARVEGQGERVRGHEVYVAGACLAGQLLAGDGEHALGEVGGDDLAVRVQGVQVQGEVAGAGGQVEGGAVRDGNGLARGGASPGAVHAQRHHAVHEVVAPGDAREHRAHVPRLVGAIARRRRAGARACAHRPAPARMVGARWVRRGGAPVLTPSARRRPRRAGSGRCSR
jgi:hypothetical protein